MEQVKLKFLCSSYSTPLTQDQIQGEGQYTVYGASGPAGRLAEAGCETDYLGIIKDGAGVGRVKIYEAGSYLLGTMAYIVPNIGVDINWLKYAVMSLNLSESISKTTIPHIYFSEYGNRKVGWCSIETQTRIAMFLDSKCAEIDSVIADTQRTIEEYKLLKQSLSTKAVTKGIHDNCEMVETDYEWIGKIPSTWKAIKVKWLLAERKERSEEGHEEPLSMSQKFGLIPTKEMDMIPNMAASFVGAKLVHIGDLVFNKLKAHLGVFAVSKYEGLVSPDYAVYHPTGLANVKYLEYLFKTPQYIAEFRKKSSGVGAGLTRLYTGDLFSIYCSLPPMEEQEEIIAYLDKQYSEIDTLIARKTALLEEMERYKKSIIYEYVTGKKEVPACQ